MTVQDVSAERHRQDPRSSADLRAVKARWATVAAFLINGLSVAGLLVRVTSLKAQHGLSVGQLGVALMAIPIAGLLAMQLAGRLVARFGSASIVRVTEVALPLSLLGIGLARNLVELTVALLVFGAANGLLDVTINAHAVTVERALRRPILNGCHAAWSSGAMIGSALGGLAIKAHLSTTEHYLLMDAVAVSLALFTGRYLLPISAEQSQDRAAERVKRASWRTGWTNRIVTLGLMGAVIQLCEGAVGNWSGVFLREDHEVSLAMASLGYICFNICQTCGRLIGDRMHERFGAIALVRASCAIGVAGLVAVVLSPGPTVAIVGFALLGVGLSTPLPIIFGTVGHGGADARRGGAAAAVSNFATLSHSGSLLGPGLIGWSAGAFGLTGTLSGLLMALVGVTLSAGAVGSAAPPKGEPKGDVA